MSALDLAADKGQRCLNCAPPQASLGYGKKQGRHSEAHDLVASVYGWFTEGFELPDLKMSKRCSIGGSRRSPQGGGSSANVGIQHAIEFRCGDFAPTVQRQFPSDVRSSPIATVPAVGSSSIPAALFKGGSGIVSAGDRNPATRCSRLPQTASPLLLSVIATISDSLLGWRRTRRGLIICQKALALCRGLLRFVRGPDLPPRHSRGVRPITPQPTPGLRPSAWKNFIKFAGTRVITAGTSRHR